MKELYDVIIVGGGIVGASLALILAQADFSVALIEANPLKTVEGLNETGRTIVLAHGTQKILESINVWHRFSESACPIKEIHVSDKGNFGCSRIFAKDEKVQALGYVLSSKTIEKGLQTTIETHPAISRLQPARFISFNYDSEIVTVCIEQANKCISLQGKVLVAADGYESTVRKFLNIDLTVKDYHQTALICNATLKRSHLETAYERFTEEGPLAMLPLTGQQCAVVWTVKKQTADELLALDRQKFIRKLQSQFGYRLGQLLQCTQPIGIDLKLTTANQQFVPGAVLLGNAAHTLHPVAGQGLNLAFRDVAIFSEEIFNAKKQGVALGSLPTLQNYYARRKKDQNEIIAITHSLVGIFSTNLLPLMLARNAGILFLDRFKSIKKMLTKRTLGLAGKVPRLACGLSLE